MFVLYIHQLQNTTFTIQQLFLPPPCPLQMSLWVDPALPKRLDFVVTLLNQLQPDPLYSTRALVPKPPQQVIQESLQYLNSLVQASQALEGRLKQSALAASSSQLSTQQTLSPTHHGRRQSVALPKAYLPTKALTSTHESQSKVIFAVPSHASTTTPMHYHKGTILLRQMMSNEEYQALHFFVRKLIEKVHCKWREESSTVSTAEPKNQVQYSMAKMDAFVSHVEDTANLLHLFTYVL